MRWWLLAVVELLVVIALVCLLIDYTGRPIIVCSAFLLLAIWELVRSLRKGRDG